MWHDKTILDHTIIWNSSQLGHHSTIMRPATNSRNDDQEAIADMQSAMKELYRHKSFTNRMLSQVNDVILKDVHLNEEVFVGAFQNKLKVGHFKVANCMEEIMVHA